MKRLILLIAMVLGCWSHAYAIDSPVSTTMQSAAAATGNGTAASTAGYASIGVQVVISDTATVSFEATVDGSNWVAVTCVLSSDLSTASSATASGLYQCNVSGYNSFRARISSYGAGTVDVKSLTTTTALKNGSTGTTGWPSSSTTKEITWANSLANAMRVGDGVTPGCFFTDATLGFLGIPCTASNTSTLVLTNFNWMLWDQEGAAAIETVDPDAASTLAMWTYGAAYRPKKSVQFLADSFNMQGGCTLNTGVALITAGLIEPYITCTDSDAAGFHRSLIMPDNWDGGTLTFKVALTNVNAAPADNYEIDFSAECEANSEVIGTTISATGEQPATFDFDNTGTCTTACAQFDLAMVTTAAVTPNGTCAAGNLLRVQGQIDATATTTTQVADVKIISVRMEYSVTSRSQ